MTGVLDATILDDHAEGLTYKEMAQRYGITLEELSVHLRRLRLLGTPAPTMAYRPRQQVDEVERIRVATPMPATEPEPAPLPVAVAPIEEPRDLPQVWNVPIKRTIPSDDEIRADRATGMTHRAMAQRYGCSLTTLGVHLKRLGISAGRWPNGPYQPPPAPVPVTSAPPHVVEVVIPEPEPIPEVIPMPVVVPPPEPIVIPEASAPAPKPVTMEPDLAQLVMIARLMREADVAADTAVSIMIAARAL